MAVDHRPAPVRLTGRAWNSAVVQAPADPGQRQAFVPDPGEDLAHNPGGLLVNLVARGSSTGFACDVAIAEGRSGQDADSTGLGAVALAAPAALQHFGPLVLGKHALNLQQQAVLGRVPDRAIEEDDLGAGVSELFSQQNLMRIAAGEAIRGMDVDEIDCRQRHEVAQTLQGWTDQAGATVAVVDEPQIIPNAVAVLCHSCGQLSQLAVNGVMLSLLIGGDPGVEGASARSVPDYTLS